MKQKYRIILVAIVFISLIATAFPLFRNYPPAFHDNPSQSAEQEIKTHIEVVESIKGLEGWGIDEHDKYVVKLTLENLTQDDLIILSAPFLHSLRIDLRDHRNRRIPLSEQGVKAVRAGIRRNDIGGSRLSVSETSTRYYDLGYFFQINEHGNYFIQMEFDYRPQNHYVLRNYRTEKYEINFH
ncbi:MAG TPA: hypothetical protein DIW81_26060 [Planctomycetaceae bacterium]|nr:hypothetical protein [Planctomycetaceae bacterium]|tara:strand:- start:192 stop:740 length:549 start_codon:yes stop_codon:yes gene_type:complete